ncbi:hypothetical protein [Primorskyibacter flagellatus]|uniref:hypothetical protein n=1 Tax=Primorskyibacter flagellatus TaxID=1387277 RepID=UPI0015C49583|nr:hypothetical protein [Primorskyibacter flagellatus]
MMIEPVAATATARIERAPSWPSLINWLIPVADPNQDNRKAAKTSSESVRGLIFNI